MGNLRPACVMGQRKRERTGWEEGEGKGSVEGSLPAHQWKMVFNLQKILGFFFLMIFPL